MEGVDQNVPFFEAHEGSLDLHDAAPDDSGQREGKVTIHVLLIGLFLVFVLL